MIAGIAIISGTNAQQRAEHEAEHDQRAEAAEQRLEQDAGAVGVAALRVERVEAGEMHRRAGDGHARERLARGLLRLRVVAEGLVGIRPREGDRERGAAVLRR